MSDFTFGKAQTVVYEWSYYLDGPMTETINGEPMRVTGVKITVGEERDGTPWHSVDVEGIVTKLDGTPDKRRTWTTIEMSDGWVHKAAWDQFQANMAQEEA